MSMLSPKSVSFAPNLATVVSPQLANPSTDANVNPKPTIEVVNEDGTVTQVAVKEPPPPPILSPKEQNSLQAQQQIKQGQSPVISFALIESFVYEALESTRVDLYQYARKEIIYNERDALDQLVKRHQKKLDQKFKLANQAAAASGNTRQSFAMTSGSLEKAMGGGGGGANLSAASAYESLYQETPLQLQEQTFTLHPSQYQLIYPQEFENLLNRISEKITSQVSEITSNMLEHIFSLQTGLPGGGREGAKQQIKDEVLREIGAEMQRFQRKYEESRELITQMRKNFLKELQHLRAADTLNRNSGQSAVQSKSSKKVVAGKYLNIGALGTAVMSAAQQQQPQQQYIEFSFFSPTEGMDEETCQIFNDNLQKMRSQFEAKLATLNAINQELAWKVSLIDDSKKVGDMNAEELLELAFSKQPDREVMWLLLKPRFSPEDFERIAEEEFADLISVITEREITTQVQRITEESQFQIKDAKEKMQKEINYLRMQVNNRTEEFEKAKLAKIIEVDRAREEGYAKAEKRFIENMRMKEAKFADERNQLNAKLQEALRDDTSKYNKLYLQHAMTRWRLILQIAKLKPPQSYLERQKEKQQQNNSPSATAKSGEDATVEEDSITLEDILGSIQKGSANMYMQQVGELIEQVRQQQATETKLRADLEQLKYIIQEKDDKNDYLLREFQNAQEETVKLRAHLESAGTENRALEDETEQQKRVLKSLQELVEQLEQEKSSLEQRVVQMKQQALQQQQTMPSPGMMTGSHRQQSSKNVLNNNLFPPPLHQQSQFGNNNMSQSINLGGGESMMSLHQQQQPSDGYDSDGSVKESQGGGGGGTITGKAAASMIGGFLLHSNTKFNSKLYAQKQLEGMIDARQSTMGKVYAAHQLNAAVDTSDLTFKMNRKTQYKNKHHDPEWDAKELAKVKHYAEAATITDFPRPISSKKHTSNLLSSEGGEQQPDDEAYSQGSYSESGHNPENGMYDGATMGLAPHSTSESRIGLRKKASSKQTEAMLMMQAGRTTPANGILGGGKWISQEEYAQLIQLGTGGRSQQIQQQLEEEKNVSTQLREALDEAEKRLEELTLQNKKLVLEQQTHGRRGSSLGGVSGIQNRSGAKTALSNQPRRVSAFGVSSAQAQQMIAEEKRRKSKVNEYDEDIQSVVSGDAVKELLKQGEVTTPELNEHEYQNAMNYLKDGKISGQHRRMRTISGEYPSAQEGIKLPQVYRRLWDGVAQKQRKVKDLTRAIDNQRRLEWLKLLLSQSHLHLTDFKKGKELLKQLAQYDEMLLSQSNASSTLHMIRGEQPPTRPATALQGSGGLSSFDMNKLVELFDEEQEAQYQRAIKAWRESQQHHFQMEQHPPPQADPNAVAVNNEENEGKVEANEEHVVEQEQQNQQQPPIQTDYVSMYITEQHPNVFPQAPQPQAPPTQIDEKECQTDLYLLESILHEANLRNNPVLLAQINQNQPAYQQRLSQYMMNKQGSHASSSGFGISGGTLYPLYGGQQHHQNANNFASVSSMRSSGGHLAKDSRVILSNTVMQGGDMHYTADLAIGDMSKTAKQGGLFNNSRIRQASHHAAVITTKQRRSAMANSLKQSPLKQACLKSTFVLESNNTSSMSTTKQTLLTSIKQPNDTRVSQVGEGSKKGSLMGRGGRGSQQQQQYQAIPTTNFLNSQPKLINGKDQLFKDVGLKGPTKQQQNPQSQGNISFGFQQSSLLHPTVTHGPANGTINIKGTTSFKDSSDPEDMFASSELNTMPPHGLSSVHMAPVMSSSANKQQINNNSAGLSPGIGSGGATFGYEPRVPKVTVNPHSQAAAEDATGFSAYSHAAIKGSRKRLQPLSEDEGHQADLDQTQ